MNPEQFEAISEMVARRMQHTGESRFTACKHIAKYLDNQPTPIRRDQCN